MDIVQPPIIEDNETRGPINKYGLPLWSAGRLRVAEKLWGEDFISPGGVDHAIYLMKPFGMTAAMSLLDLTAGLGGIVRTIAQTYKSWCTGMEASPMMAQMAMQRSEKLGLSKQASIEAYDPNDFTLSRRYDAIFAKELFFTIENKDKFLDIIVGGLKENGQLLFTDYCLQGADLSDPRLVGWISNEPVEPHLWTVNRMVQALKSRRLDVRTNEDITEVYKDLIIKSLIAFKTHLQIHAIDDETRQAVSDELDLWSGRAVALEAGLKVYRFYCMKH